MQIVSLPEYKIQYLLLCPIDRSAPSIVQTALSIDPLLTQPLIDPAAPSVDGFGAGRTVWNGPSWVFYHCFTCPSALEDG